MTRPRLAPLMTVVDCTWLLLAALVSLLELFVAVAVIGWFLYSGLLA